MAEHPDFEQIARTMADTFMASLKTGPPKTSYVEAIAEALRDVWNARGAADIARLQALDVMVSADTLRSLDR